MTTKVKKIFIYHCWASCVHNSTSKQISGAIETDEEILAGESYQEFRDKIFEDFDVDPNETIIHSLSLLGVRYE